MKNLNYNYDAQSFTQLHKKTDQLDHTGGSHS